MITPSLNVMVDAVSFSLRSMRISAILCLPLLTAVASADVILVDQSGAPDADFSDLPPALAAAQHNDLILVRAGNYSGFSTGNGVRILGIEDGVNVFPEVKIESLESGRKFAMSLVYADSLKVLNCQGHVSFGAGRREWSAWWSGAADSLVITGSSDVRVSDWVFFDDVIPGQGVVTVEASVVELVRCRIRGGLAYWSDTQPIDGGAGLIIDGKSDVRLSLSEVFGGMGSDLSDTCGFTCTPADGGPGVQISGASNLVITGDGPQEIGGGQAGLTEWDEGWRGPALLVQEASTVRYSGVYLSGSPSSFGSDPIVEESGGVAYLVPISDPTMQILGDPVPGATLTMRVTGPPGGNVRCLLGRTPEINQPGGGVGQDLLVELRIVSPGSISTLGVVEYDFTLPPNLPQGMYFLGQATVVHQGTTYRTASQVVLVH